MSSLASLQKRLEKLERGVEKKASGQEDVIVLQLINASLMRDLELLPDDGKMLPEEFEQYLEQTQQMQEEEWRAYTPRQRRILESFAQRYNAAAVKDELIQRLSIPDDEEDSRV